MFADLKKLENTLAEMSDKIGERQYEIANIFIWLEKYIRIVYEERKNNLKGDDLKTALDSSINIAIELFDSIDAGSEGFDDKLAEEFKKIRDKYLGA